MNRSQVAGTGATVLLLTTCAAAGGALPTSAKLTPGGLGRIKVGMTERQVERVLERNLTLTGPANDGSCTTAGFGRRNFLLFSNGRLGRVSVGTRRYATKSGLRVGMPESAVTDKYGSRAKRSPHAYTKGSYLKVTRGNRRLVFETDGEKITQMSGGRRPEVDYIEACS